MAEMQDMLKEALNVRISGRHMVKNAWGGSLALRKYLSFFGSKTFAVFGEARLYGNYGRILSCPIDKVGVYEEKKMRTSDIYSAGLKLGAGLCVKLRDNSALTIGIPIIGASYDYTRQSLTSSVMPFSARMGATTSFRISSWGTGVAATTIVWPFRAS